MRAGEYWDIDKADLAGKIAPFVGEKLPLDYDGRSSRRNAENRIVGIFDGAKSRISPFGDISNASIRDIITTDIQLSIKRGQTPLVNIESAITELERLDNQYNIQEAKPTSGKRGSYGQKMKALSLVEEKRKPLRALINNYGSGNVLFDFNRFTKSQINEFLASRSDSTLSSFVSTAKKPASVFIDQIKDIPDSTVPDSATIGASNITENSVFLSWNPHGNGGSPITNYHLLIKDEDNNQTKYEFNPSYNTTSTIVSSLDSGVNYKAYIIVINAIGNSTENSTAFRTKVIDQIFPPPPDPVDPPPTVDPSVPVEPPVENSLLAKVMGITALLGTLALLGSKGR
jgi:hypothetical protein